MNHPSVVNFLLLILGSGVMLLGLGSIDDALPYAAVAIIIGGVLLIASFYTSCEWVIRAPPSSSTLPALYVAVQFIAGAYFVFLGVSNQLLDLNAFDLGLSLVSMLGIVLVVDSLILYKEGFKNLRVGQTP